MSSQLKIEANRRNAKKSTGPRTPAGKAASSLNHIKSGLYAQSQIIIGERQSDFEDLARAFHAHYRPDTPERQSLVDIAIHSEWILRRLRCAETGLWDSYIDEYDHGSDSTGLGRAFDHRDKTFNRLQRRLDSLQRNFQRALKELDRLQAAQPHQPQPQPQPAPAPQPRPIAPAPPPPPAAPPAQATLKPPALPPPFGFESSPSPSAAPSRSGVSPLRAAGVPKPLPPRTEPPGQAISPVSIFSSKDEPENRQGGRRK